MIFAFRSFPFFFCVVKILMNVIQGADSVQREVKGSSEGPQFAEEEE